jgi:hypothetical protein
MSTIFLNILTPLPLNTKEAGSDFFQAWLELLPEYAPERYGNWEPLKSKFDPGDLAAVAETWSWPFLFKRSKPKMEGRVFMRPGVQLKHSWVHILFDEKQFNQAKVVNFLCKMSGHLKADFAFIHLLAESEVNRGLMTNTINPLGRRKGAYNLAVTTENLNRNLPELYWGTVFGPAYVDLFGREHLLNAPASHIEEVSPYQVYIQLSEHVQDMKTKFEEVESTRHRIKAYLNNDAFFDPTVNGMRPYKTPQFHWS